MRDIYEDRLLSGFPRLVTPSIHTKVLEVQVVCRNSAEFEGQLLERYKFDDSFRLSKREFMEWIENPGKGRNTPALLQEFEMRFARLSTLDQTVLDTTKVLLFIKSVHVADRERVVFQLETDEGLTTD